MSEIKNSPGPWKFGYTDNLEHPIIMSANCEIVCIMREGVSVKDGKLLAMAPELLEALSKFVGFAEQYGEVVFAGGGMPVIDAMNACTTKARAAIAKAKGESKYD